MQYLKLVAGLGNPGREYENTRHNFGFLAIDALLDMCAAAGSVERLSGAKDSHALWRARLPLASPGPASFFLLKPLTFMNRSGEPLQRVAAYYGVQPEELLVLHDELDLAPGRMKLKRGGGNAGHNGLKSIQQHLGTPEFYRLRLGIGKPPAGPATSYVLARFQADERPMLRDSLEAACRGVLLFLEHGPRAAQEFCNGYKPAVLPDAAKNAP